MDDGGSETIDASQAGGSTVHVGEEKLEPYEGMAFDSEDAARTYYDEYVQRVGFSTRVLSSRRSERDGSIISRGLGCRGITETQKSGSISNEIGEKGREVCSAMFIVKREHEGRWVVWKFTRDHNHPLVLTLPKRRATFDEKDKKIQELTAELRVKKRLSAAYREQLLALMKDVENHNNHLANKIQTIRNNLEELDMRRQELSTQDKMGS